MSRPLLLSSTVALPARRGVASVPSKAWRSHASSSVKAHGAGAALDIGDGDDKKGFGHGGARKLAPSATVRKDRHDFREYSQLLAGSRSSRPRLGLASALDALRRKPRKRRRWIAVGIYLVATAGLSSCLPIRQCSTRTRLGITSRCSRTPGDTADWIWAGHPPRTPGNNDFSHVRRQVVRGVSAFSGAAAAADPRAASKSPSAFTTVSSFCGSPGVAPALLFLALEKLRRFGRSQLERARQRRPQPVVRVRQRVLLLRRAGHGLVRRARGRRGARGGLPVVRARSRAAVAGWARARARLRDAHSVAVRGAAVRARSRAHLAPALAALAACRSRRR